MSAVAGERQVSQVRVQPSSDSLAQARAAARRRREGGTRLEWTITPHAAGAPATRPGK